MVAAGLADRVEIQVAYAIGVAHPLSVNVETFGTGKIAEEALHRARITVNKNAVPNDPQKPWVTSGVRIGTPALTTRGFDRSCQLLLGDRLRIDFQLEVGALADGEACSFRGRIVGKPSRRGGRGRHGALARRRPARRRPSPPSGTPTSPSRPGCPCLPPAASWRPPGPPPPSLGIAPRSVLEASRTECACPPGRL